MQSNSWENPPQQKVAISATFTSEPVRDSLAYWLEEAGFSYSIEFASYNQVFQELLNPHSLLGGNKDGVNVVLLRLEDWQEKGDGLHSASQNTAQLEKNVKDFSRALKTAASRSKTPYLICICPPAPTIDLTQSEQYEQIQGMLEADLVELSGVYLIKSNSLLSTYPVADYYDPYGDASGHIPYTPVFFCALGTMLARKIYTLKSSPYKVIVLDCDRTLWNGACGEEGVEAITIDLPYRSLQAFMVRQQEAGKLLCLCSKNQQEDVFAVFDYHADMVMSRHHLVNWRINWRPKSENLKDLAAELQLGLESFIFIDDNPVECAEVRANCPEVLTLQLPEDISRIPQVLEQLWVFDQLQVTGEDQQRTERYRQNVQRQRLQENALTFSDFLAQLNLEIEISPLQPDQLARAAQLTQRTNQFNFTTVRRSQVELQYQCHAGWECWVVNVKDRFGDYGLVGLLLFERQKEALFVDTFLLSCRVLGRGVEHRMLAYLGNIAQTRGLERVDLPYKPTQKNQPAGNFLAGIDRGFRQEQAEGWLFQFPVKFLTELTFAIADEAPTDAASISRSYSTAVSGLPNSSRARLFERIAHLNTPELILKEIILRQQSQRADLNEEYVAPRTSLEKLIASLFAEALKLDKVGIYDDFFYWGGDSIRGAILINKLQTQLNQNFHFVILFDTKTVAALAAYIEQNYPQAVAEISGTVDRALETAEKLVQPTQFSTIPVLPRENSAGEPQMFPLSFAQARLWFLNQLQPNSAFYNIPFALRLSGQLNVAALEFSLNQIIRRHEALRTNFTTLEGQPVQAIASTWNLKLDFVDLHNLPLCEREVETQRLATTFAEQPFDLEREPLLRTMVLQLDEAEYALLLAMHHIISDGWSVGVLYRELAALYEAFCTGRPTILPELPVQYADFAVWQRHWLTGDVLETQLNYWKQQLSGAPALLELPTERVRPSVQTYRGAHQQVVLSKELTEALMSLSQRLGVTLFMTLLAAFQTLLFRYTGQTDICVGTPHANRSRSEIDPLIGFFVNTLVMRVDLSGNPSFEELLLRVRDVALGAYAHQDLPFEKLVEELQPVRSLSYTPLFQVMLVLNQPMPPIEMAGLTGSWSAIETAAAKFDLALSLENTATGLIGEWEYNTDLFDDAAIACMSKHFLSLLKGMIANPQERLSFLPILSAAERQQLLVEWNNTTTNYPYHKCIHQLFEEQVERTPNAVAVLFENQQLTYLELNAQANHLAHYLQSLGVEPEVLVGVCVERTPLMVVGFLGILKAGGAYLPIDPAYPPERIATMLSDSQPPVLLTTQKLIASLPRHQAQVVCLDTDWAEISEMPALSPNSNVTPENLAYVIYTSGSTGKPKGILMPHRGLCNFAVAEIKLFDVQPSSCVLQFASLSFDPSICEIVMALCAGAKLCLGTPEELQPGEALLQLLQERKITHLMLVPSVLATLPFVELPALQNIIVLGEICPLNLVTKWSRGRRFFNAYGPSETICATVAQYQEGAGVLPSGRPIDNTQVYILDPYLQPVPIGVPGEVHIAGVQLARGYLNRSDLTDEKFISNPFFKSYEFSVLSSELEKTSLPQNSKLKIQNSKLYKTGDLARYLSDGNIEYFGRLDNQIKIRGFRIELGEVEGAIASHPAVDQTTVIVREDIPDRKYLAAYIVPKNSEAIASSDLRGFLRRKLPSYMVPGAFVILDALPLTPNGKVDRRALPTPQIARQELEAAFVAPRTWSEELLAQIWREVLQLKHLSIHDNFFELGGDSILSIQIISRAKQAGLQLTPKQMFEHQTIAELADVAIVTQTGRAEQGLVTGSFPLTPIQHWFFEQNLPEAHHFNQTFLLSVPPTFDPILLERVVKQLLVHHDALRLRVVRSGSDWQLLHAAPDDTIPFSQVNLSTLPDAEQKAAIEATAAELQVSLNLSSGPLVRVVFFALGTDKPSRLLIIIHHLVVDEVSWRILLEDLQTAYQQLSRGEAIALPPKTTSFKDWAFRLTEYARSNAIKSELAYWLALSHRQMSIPVDYARGTNTFASARTVSMSLDVEETHALLHEVPKAYKTEINDIMLTALVQVLGKWIGNNSLLLDLQSHERENIFSDVDLSRTIGCFTTIFPVLLQLEPTDNPGEALKSIKEQLRGILNQGIGYGLLRYLSEDAEIASQLSALQTSEVSFSYLSQFDEGMLEGSKHSNLGHRSHLLSINSVVVAGHLQLDWTYSENFHQRATIESLVQNFAGALRSLIAHCLSPNARGYTPSDFPLAELDQQELDDLFAEIEKMEVK